MRMLMRKSANVNNFQQANGAKRRMLMRESASVNNFQQANGAKRRVHSARKNKNALPFHPYTSVFIRMNMRFFLSC